MEATAEMSNIMEAEGIPEIEATAEMTGTTATRGSVLTGTIMLSQSDDFGEILMDAGGRTLYLFTEDTAGVSTCRGDCA